MYHDQTDLSLAYPKLSSLGQLEVEGFMELLAWKHFAVGTKTFHYC